MSEHWTPSLGALGKSASVRFWLHIPELGAPTITLEELIDEVHHSRLPFDERLRHDVQISLCGNGGERRKASTTLLGLLSGRVALPGLGAACGVPTGGPDTLPAGLVEAAVVSILQIDRAVADRDWAQLVTLMHATADVCAAQRRAMRAMEEAAGQDAAFAPPPSEVLNALGAGASAQAHCLSTTSCFLSTLPALLLSRALGEGGHQAACGARLGLASLAVRLAWLHLDEPGLARHAVLALVGATGGPDGRGLSEDDLCAAWLPCLESGAPALLLECADRCAGDDEVALAAADALRCAAASQAPDAAAAFCDQYIWAADTLNSVSGVRPPQLRLLAVRLLADQAEIVAGAEPRPLAWDFLKSSGALAAASAAAAAASVQGAARGGGAADGEALVAATVRCWAAVLDPNVGGQGASAAVAADAAALFRELGGARLVAALRQPPRGAGGGGGGARGGGAGALSTHPVPAAPPSGLALAAASLAERATAAGWVDPTSPEAARRAAEAEAELLATVDAERAHSQRRAQVARRGAAAAAAAALAQQQQRKQRKAARPAAAPAPAPAEAAAPAGGGAVADAAAAAAGDDDGGDASPLEEEDVLSMVRALGARPQQRAAAAAAAAAEREAQQRAANRAFVQAGRAATAARQQRERQQQQQAAQAQLMLQQQSQALALAPAAAPHPGRRVAQAAHGGEQQQQQQQQQPAAAQPVAAPEVTARPAQPAVAAAPPPPPPPPGASMSNDTLASLFPWLSLAAVPAPQPQPQPSASDDDDACIVCLDSVRGVALLPCGHALFCACCAASVLGQPAPTCPQCRVPCTGSRVAAGPD